MFLTIESKTYMAGSFLCGGTCHSVSDCFLERSGCRSQVVRREGWLLGTSRSDEALRTGVTYFLYVLLQGLCNWEGIVGQVSCNLGQVRDFEP